MYSVPDRSAEMATAVSRETLLIGFLCAVFVAVGVWTGTGWKNYRNPAWWRMRLTMALVAFVVALLFVTWLLASGVWR